MVQNMEKQGEVVINHRHRREQNEYNKITYITESKCTGHEAIYSLLNEHTIEKAVA